jgi:hypothetical protein
MVSWNHNTESSAQVDEKWKRKNLNTRFGHDIARAAR